MLLTSMRHMTDQEWFASLSKKPKNPEEIKQKGHTRNRSSGSNLPGLSRHKRSDSSASLSPQPSPKPSLRRSASGASTGSTLDSDGLAELTNNMRKRDRILRRMPRRRRTREGAADHGHVYRDGNDPYAEMTQILDNTSIIKLGSSMSSRKRHWRGEDGVCTSWYVLTFDTADEKAYFGVGLKGVGKTELRKSSHRLPRCHVLTL
jgi:hypothetical protein